MTHTGIVSIGDGDLLPWQQPRDTIRTFFQSQFDDVISESSSHNHETSFPEIDSVADANLSLVCQKETNDIEEVPEEDISEEDVDENGGNRKSNGQTASCSFNERKLSCDKLRTCALKCRRCFCSNIDEGESGVMSPWGGTKEIRTLNSGVSLSKRKAYTVFQRPSGEYKFKSFEFRHTSDSHDHIDQYRKYHTVADVGKEERQPPTFGVDVPDPYAVKVKNICSIVDSCDFTALLTVDNDNSCSDFNSVISAASSDSCAKEREKGVVGGKSKRKKGEKPPLLNTRSVPTLVQGRQKKDGTKSDRQTIHAHDPKSLRNYVDEYEKLRREREALQKSNTLPQIPLQTESASGRSRPNSDSSSVTNRLLQELDSPFKRLLQCKYSKGTPVEFLRETYHERTTSVKLSEFLSQALLGDERLRTGPKKTAIKPAGKVKVKTKDNQKDDQVKTHFPELVGQAFETQIDSRIKKSELTSCQKVLSLSIEDVEISKERSVRNSGNAVAEDKIPMEYKAKKRKMHKIVDLMSIPR